ncbi:hypothetical protein [Bradyrhizobium sp. LHD-71]|uniref:2-amino-5-chloromuconate deaminase CnbZ n=1 Tax=Bradyrhizobium sp. LHD-71 TaxID=3072141 RepID=UPI00280F2DD6|nr:hypothetical protein [Bradyrhizobium sp. LHD-71]MDQ8730850.1 hypothetical protein [Bradyrhizobium sp. LHD-71]
MAEIIDFKAGDFSFLVAPGGPFSGGVRANKGFALHRARFDKPVPMMDGFKRIKQHLEKLGRPVTALAACELRSPKPMTVQEFQAFNRDYLTTLHAWGCRDGEINAPARSNIAPITEAPADSSFFAFTYTVPDANAAGDFLISGLPEIKVGAAAGERTFGGRDVSLKGLAAKARFVMEGLRTRVDALGCDWNGITASQVYTVHDFRPVLEDLFAELRISQIGVAWYPAWPPVNDMDFEVDVRRVRTEIVI